MKIPMPLIVLGVLASIAGAAEPAFTSRERDAFVAQAEAAAHKVAVVSPGFWEWLSKHPDVKTGLLVASNPMPAAYAQNLDLM